mmetsp:Transcript_123729/g.346501  ORF Transcript_123729/g.346501 Transcript_123729/m.346501 type:complete len:352 (-) Transcript_123729:232-1287(-)
MAPTAKRNPSLLSAKSTHDFQAERHLEAPPADVCSQNAPSGVAPSCSTRAPTVAMSENSRHNMDAETAMWACDGNMWPPLAEAPGHQDDLVPQDLPPRSRRASRLVVIGMAMALALIVVLLAIFLIVSDQDGGDPTTLPAAGPSNASGRNEDIQPGGAGTPPQAATSTSWTSTTTSTLGDPCYLFVSRLNMNDRLQAFPDNPDRKMWGTATILLCTNGTLQASALLHNGRSQLIASHIRQANGTGNTDGGNGMGGVVIAFCGSNAAQSINVGKAYPVQCAGWTGFESKNDNMPGVLVDESMSVEERVEDIRARTGMYYMSFDSEAGWKQWQPTGTDRGVVRGMLDLRGTIQ